MPTTQAEIDARRNFVESSNCTQFGVFHYYLDSVPFEPPVAWEFAAASAFFEPSTTTRLIENHNPACLPLDTVCYIALLCWSGFSNHFPVCGARRLDGGDGGRQALFFTSNRWGWRAFGRGQEWNAYSGK
jgi:hypothetical protein